LPLLFSVTLREAEDLLCLLMLSLLLLLGICVGLQPPKNKSKNNRHTLSISPHPLRRINRASKYALTNKGTSNAIPHSSQLREDKKMRFMVIGKATAESEKEGALPDPQLMADMGKYNEELMKAGVLLALDGLHPSSKGARVKFSGKSRTVIDGPFTETKELIAGFSILQVNSLQEAIEWVKRCPNCSADDYEVEIRQVFEMEDFAPILSEEQVQHKIELRAELPNQTANK
jgi:hypothetical protein